MTILVKPLHPTVGSTWIRRSDGQAFVLDYVRDRSSYAMRRWAQSEYATIPVDHDELLNSWSMVETMSQAMTRRYRERAMRCLRGYHEDPDNSGLCIHCSAATDGDKEID